MRRLILALSAIALVAALVWAFMPSPVPVELAEVAPRTITVTVEEEGVAEIREVFVVSATIAGQLQRLNLHAGDTVVADKTVVALIGPAPPALLDARARAVAEATVAAAQAAVDLARAQLMQAEAASEFRSTEASRAKALFERLAISQSARDAAILEERSALAAVDSAKANLSVRNRELESARAVLEAANGTVDPACCERLVSPVSGRVLRVLTENAQVVAPGTPILEVGNPGDLEIVVELLSRDAVRVRPGANATISGWGGPALTARVARVEPSAVTRVSALGIEEQRVEVALTLSGDPSQWQSLGHGFRAVAEITLWQGDAVLSIPVGALFRDGSNWAAYVLRDDRAHLQLIRLGERDADHAQVLDGLVAGDQVILHPSDRVADGTRVQPLPVTP
ncbi:MAG: HlyD family efflux transporter periplasmic adaptor subunit [Tabrizicola sp.]|jgi:HlyD family secretion protein|nr:HlyD family efflux transporter periplasmic adaptor subunit [Tabrizicola sp.]